MASLKNTVKKTVNYVDYWRDWNDFVKEAYGIGEDSYDSYDCASSEEASNGSILHVVAEKKELDSYDQKKINDLVSKGESFFTLDAIAKDLCNKGLLEPGEYMIHVSW